MLRLTTFLCLLMTSLPACGADVEKVLYDYLFAGQPVGRETVEISRVDAGTTIKTRAVYTVRGQKFDMTVTEKTDGRGELLSLRAEGIFGNHQLSADLEMNPADGLLSAAVEYRGSRSAKLRLPEGTVLEPTTMASLERILTAFGGSKAGEIRYFHYLDPIFLVNLEGTIELIDETVVEKEGKNVKVLHYLLKTADTGYHAFLSGGGELLQVSIPLGAMLIVREGWRDLIEVKLPEPDLEAETLYKEEQVTFPANDVEMHGAVTIPNNGAEKHPALILVSGSGAQDLNEDTPLAGPYGLKAGIFRTLSDRLSNAGYLVLRYNDYGVPPSGGMFATHTLEDRVVVARGAVRYLQSRKDVDKRRIGVLGHSEGGIIAPIVAVADPEVKAIVLMAGTARPIDQVVMEQSLALSSSLEAFTTSIPDLMEGWAEVRSGKDWGRFGGLDNQFLGWWRSHMFHDAYATMQRVHCKVLILNGQYDKQVLPGNALNLALALEEGGNKGYVLKILPKLDHLFMPSSTKGSTADYADFRRKLDPGFLDFLKAWLKDNL